METSQCHITVAQISELRGLTGAGILDCREALQESGGDIEGAKSFLRQKGEDISLGRSVKPTGSGTVGNYLHHNGSIGTMVVVTCETDFVAATEDLKSFAHEVALHVAATKPEFIGREDVPSFAVATEEVFLSEQAASSGKPANVIAQMVKGRMGKFFSAHCLLEQPFVRDDKRTVGDLLNDVRIKVGERVEIESFCWMGLQDVSLVKRGES